MSLYSDQYNDKSLIFQTTKKVYVPHSQLGRNFSPTYYNPMNHKMINFNSLSTCTLGDEKEVQYSLYKSRSPRYIMPEDSINHKYLQFKPCDSDPWY